LDEQARDAAKAEREADKAQAAGERAEDKAQREAQRALDKEQRQDERDAATDPTNPVVDNTLPGELPGTEGEPRPDNTLPGG
jgi:hypothetical protein